MSNPLAISTYLLGPIRRQQRYASLPARLTDVWGSPKIVALYKKEMLMLYDVCMDMCDYFSHNVI
jgi:hypothetical protein